MTVVWFASITIIILRKINPFTTVTVIWRFEASQLLFILVCVASLECYSLKKLAS